VRSRLLQRESSTDSTMRMYENVIASTVRLLSAQLTPCSVQHGGGDGGTSNQWLSEYICHATVHLMIHVCRHMQTVQTVARHRPLHVSETVIDHAVSHNVVY